MRDEDDAFLEEDDNVGDGGEDGKDPTKSNDDDDEESLPIAEEGATKATKEEGEGDIQGEEAASSNEAAAEDASGDTQDASGKISEDESKDESNDAEEPAFSTGEVTREELDAEEEGKEIAATGEKELAQKYAEETVALASGEAASGMC